MKKIIGITALGLLLGATGLMAQSARYVPAMKSDLKLLTEAKTMQDYNRVAAAFTRIGNAEKTLWLPYYYAALAKLHGAISDASVDKDKIAAEVDSLLAKAETIEKNTELTTLHYYNEVIKMTVNPAARFMEKAPLMEKYFKVAVAQDSTNPRIYFLKGQTVYHTPESFGGGAGAALPLFQKAVDLFAEKDSTINLMPNWGRADAAAMLKKCKQ